MSYQLVYYDNIGYYTDDIGYIEGIPQGIAEPYPSDLRVVNNYLEKFPDKCNTYIDVGSHIGTTCLPFSRIYKSVIGFEVNNNNFNLLEKNITLNNANNIIVNNFGLYNENCMCNIYSHKQNASGCFFLKKEENGNILCKTLDTYCMENDIKNVDYIKIDTEGTEVFVLEGALQTIKKNKPLISIEYNGLSNRFFNINEKHTFDFFDNMDYVLYDRSPKSQNLFFIHKDDLSS